MTKRDNQPDEENQFAAYLRRGTQLLQRRELEKATKLLTKAVEMDDSHVDAAINLAGAHILSKKFKQAVAILEPMVEQNPNHAMLWTNLGAAYLGNPILADDAAQLQAIDAFQRALALDPVAPHVAYNIGLIYRDRREYAVARDWFQRAIQTDPNDRDARSLMQKMEDQIANDARDESG